MTSKYLRATALAFATLTLMAPGALAAEVPVSGGDADWGVKESFRNYVTGPGANGTITTSQGATKNPDGTFDFTSASGVLDVDAGTGNVAFDGSVFFQGSPGGIPNALEVRITSPRLQYAGNGGILYADVTSKEAFGPGAGTTTAYPNIDFGTVDLTGVTPTGTETSVSLTPSPMVLTENGAKAFAGFYEPGTELDPISFRVDLLSEAGTIAPGKRKQSVKKNDLRVELAKVGCLAATCTVEAPRKLTAKIKGGESNGEKVRVKLMKPMSLQGGSRDVIEAKFKKRVVKQLARGGKLKLSTELNLVAGGLSTSEDVKVTVRR